LKSQDHELWPRSSNARCITCDSSIPIKTFILPAPFLLNSLTGVKYNSLQFAVMIHQPWRAPYPCVAR
jgi:hypothetical protein